MITIIIPIYNKGTYLKRCLESVQCQSCTDFECLLIDNNSTDNSREICESFLSDKRFKLYSCIKQGVSAARNVGIDEAKGDWIVFIDADDYLNSDYLEVLYNTTKTHPDYKCYTCCGHTIHGNKESLWNNVAEGERTEDEVGNFNLGVRWATVWNGIWKAEVFKGTSPIRFNENCRVGEDELVCVEYWFKYHKLYHISYAGYNHVLNETSISKNNEYYKNYSSTIIPILENLIHNYKPNKNVIDNIRNIYEEKINKKSDGIDYVVPYSINSIESIKNKIKQVKNTCGYDIYDTEEELLKRYNSEDRIFRMNIRSVAKYMPFIRMIHLIVEDESHVPSWIDKTKIHIVYHKDFMPEELLPTYNSRTIECYLGNIPFLGSKILYGNSDYVALRPLKESDFFILDNTRNNFAPLHTPAWQFVQACKTTYKTIFTNQKDDKFLTPIIHCFTPMITSRIKQVGKIYKEKLFNSCTAFRNGKNINQYIYPLYDKYIGKAVFSELTAYTCINRLYKPYLYNNTVICLEDMDDNNPIVGEVENYTNFEKCKYEL